MTEHFVANAGAMAEGERLIVAIGDDEVGVFRHKGRFFAYSNFCLHSGGPACEGLIIAKVEEAIAPDQTSKGLFFSDEETHFVCPWHGYEYNIENGECAADRSIRLRSYDVVERDGKILVLA